MEREKRSVFSPAVFERESAIECERERKEVVSKIKGLFFKKD